MIIVPIDTPAKLITQIAKIFIVETDNNRT